MSVRLSVPGWGVLVLVVLELSLPGLSVSKLNVLVLGVLGLGILVLGVAGFNIVIEFVVRHRELLGLFA